MSSSDIIGDIVICMGSSSSISMKLHRFPRAFWDHVQPAHEPQPTEAAVRKRLRSLAPKMDDSNESFSVADSYELKSFIKPDSGPRRLSTYTDEAAFTKTHLSADQETHAGGTRWNPTQGQIGLLEMLYKGGIRTPNAHQIEQIAEKLAKYGKIEGKNVFYWFQNHKARERQKQKRERLGHSHHPPSQEPATARSAMTTMLSSDIVAKEDHGVGVSGGAHKRRCRSWTLDRSADEEEPNEANNNRSCRSDDEGSICRTLQLFPLHPEGKR